MAKQSTGRLLADELHRVLDDFQRVGADIERLAAERKRLSMVAHRLLQLLRSLASQRAADRLVEDLGLAEALAKLPVQPGRKPAPATEPARPAAAPRAARTEKTVPEPLAAGTPIRIENGKYAGWTGLIRWTHVQGTARTYTATITGPDGKRTRTQVAHATQGTSWVVTGEPGKTTTSTKARSVKQTRAARTRPGPTTTTPAVPSDLLAKRASITMVTGMYAGYLGDVVSVRPKPGPVANAIYTVRLTGPAGQRARTQIAHRSLGKSWALAGGTETAESPARVTRKVVRRRAQATEAAVGAPAPAVEPAGVVAPVAGNKPSPILPKGAPVRMLSGIYLGYTGVVSSMHALPGPRPDAVYTLTLRGPKGERARTSAKQGTLGRTWVRG